VNRLEEIIEWDEDTLSGYEALSKALFDNKGEQLDDSPYDRMTENEIKRTLEPLYEKLNELTIASLFFRFEPLLVEKIKDKSGGFTDSSNDIFIKNVNNYVRKNVDSIPIKIKIGLFRGYVDDSICDRIIEIKDFRDYIAHGKTGRRPKFIEPRQAYGLLKDFIIQIDA